MRGDELKVGQEKVMSLTKGQNLREVEQKLDMHATP